MRHSITFACLAAAAGFYYTGMETNGAILFGIGGLCELVFWKRLLRRPPARAAA